MFSAPPQLTLSVHHDSWIRQQIRDLVLHLPAPIETAELLQVGLITLAHCAAHLDQEPATEEGQTAFVARTRERIRLDLVDEVRQMTHLSRLQRRRWTLVKLAREHLQKDRRAPVGIDEPVPQEISLLTGLSVHEVQVLNRLAGLGPWEPEQGSHHLMELRAMRHADDPSLARAREDTRVVLERIGHLLRACPPQRLALLQRHFGVSCVVDGESLAQPPRQQTLLRVRRLARRTLRLLGRGLLAYGLDRRVAGEGTRPSSLDELWPQRLNALLQPRGFAGLSPAGPHPAG